MDALEDVVVGEALILRMVTASNPMIAIRIVHAMGLSCSNQLMSSDQNAHAFRPNSFVAKMKVSKS